MMNFLFDYGMFLAKALTVAVCILLVVAGAAAGRRHRQDDEEDKMRIPRSMNISSSNASASMPNCSTKKR